MAMNRSFLFPAALLATAVLGACASTSPCCCNGKDPQAVVTATAAANPGVARLTIHCKNADGTATACASTAAEKKGKASDKEDLEAMDQGQPVVLAEPNGLDVTVPFLKKDGKFTGACGVTFADKGMDKGAAVQKAAAIAQSIETALGGCCGTCK